MTTPYTEIEITGKSQLIDYFAAGNKSPENRGVGTEHEKLLYSLPQLQRLGYEGQPGIAQLLEDPRYSQWQPVKEEGRVIGLEKNGASITIEPGGQYELSGRNFSDVHQTYAETRRHFQKLTQIGQESGFISLAMGFDPLRSRAEMPWMPKERYRIMKAYMPLKGTLGHDMMTRTATIQVNLDYLNETDMVKKMRVAQAIQPIVTALFANSPFSEGKPNGYLSYRAQVWDDTDPDRCGFLPFVFDAGFGFERWTEYLLQMPMYFIYRQGRYISSQNLTFGEFMKGKHALTPTLHDWDIHVSTAFPDVRLKKFIEMRGADASCVEHISALAAFWVGLFYNDEALETVCDYTRQWKTETIREVREQVPKLALAAKHGNINVLDAARQLIKISSAGLTGRSRELNIEDENRYLTPIMQIAESGITQAQRHLDEYHRNWQGNLAGMIKHLSKPKPVPT